MIHPTPRFCRSAFTLVELLVVIAIIAVLAALAMPFVNGAINRSQSAKSLANLKEIGRTTLTWAGENNGRFPLTSGGNSLPGGNNFWFRYLEEYVLGWKRGPGSNTVPPMFRCPVLKRTPPGQNQPTPDYASNTWVLIQADGPRPSPNHPWPAPNPPAGRALSSLLVPQPSKTIMFTTGNIWRINAPFVTGGGNETDIHTGLQSGEAFGAVFCDGHVELIPRAKIFDDPDAMANRRALFDPFYQAP
jgi:prepilin-type N-terminal cleavage/methylation domain-containing protein